MPQIAKIQLLLVQKYYSVNMYTYWTRCLLQFWRGGCDCKALGILLLNSLGSLTCRHAVKAGFLGFLKWCLLTPCLNLASGMDKRILEAVYWGAPVLSWVSTACRPGCFSFFDSRALQCVDAKLSEMPGSCPEKLYPRGVRIFYCISIFSRRREKYLKEQDSSCYRWSYKSIPHNSPEILSRVSCRFHYILSLRFLLLHMIIFFNSACEDISCKGFPQQTGPSLFPHWQSKGRRYLCGYLEP